MVNKYERDVNFMKIREFSKKKKQKKCSFKRWTTKIFDGGVKIGGKKMKQSLKKSNLKEKKKKANLELDGAKGESLFKIEHMELI